VTIAAWPVASGAARPGLDRSWQVALHLATGHELRHGVDFVFTFGPLGFLGFPQPSLGASSSLALIASAAIYLALVGTMMVEARRAMPIWAAALVTFLVARTFVFLPPFEALHALAFLWSVEALAGRIPMPTAWLVGGAGMLSGVAAMGKLNVGVFVASMLAVTAVTISRSWWRGLLLYGATASVTFVCLWFVLGQQVTDLGAFAAGAYQIIAGYQAAMGQDPTADRAWILLALVAVIAALSVRAARASRLWPRRRRVGLAAVALTMVFAMWKLGVVREHSTYAFAMAIIGLFAFAGPPLERRTWLAAVFGLGLVFAAGSGISPGAYLDVVGSVRSMAREANAGLRPDQVERAAQRNREALRAEYGLEPSILAAVAGRTTHIDPVEAAVAYAYPEIRWAPLPIFQTYSAYTPMLDALNAERLRSTDAPETILRQFRLRSTGCHHRRWALAGSTPWPRRWRPSSLRGSRCVRRPAGAERTSTSCGPPERVEIRLRGRVLATAD
jgi:hypothetical protein